jgi:hypothetical protein
MKISRNNRMIVRMPQLFGCSNCAFSNAGHLHICSIRFNRSIPCGGKYVHKKLSDIFKL